MSSTDIIRLQSDINRAIERGKAASSMSVQAVDELTAFYKARAQKAAVADRLFEENGEWHLTTIWEPPKVWVPVIKTNRPFCYVGYPGHLTYRCGRPEGHTGRHATIEFQSFASGGLRSRLMRRVLAVWP